MKRSEFFDALRQAGAGSSPVRSRRSRSPGSKASSTRCRPSATAGPRHWPTRSPPRTTRPAAGWCPSARASPPRTRRPCAPWPRWPESAARAAHPRSTGSRPARTTRPTTAAAMCSSPGARTMPARARMPGVDLERDPDAMLDPVISARILIRGLIDGRWNGRGMRRRPLPALRRAGQPQGRASDGQRHRQVGRDRRILPGLPEGDRGRRRLAPRPRRSRRSTRASCLSRSLALMPGQQRRARPWPPGSPSAPAIRASSANGCRARPPTSVRSAAPGRSRANPPDASSASRRIDGPRGSFSTRCRS